MSRMCSLHQAKPTIRACMYESLEKAMLHYATMSPAELEFVGGALARVALEYHGSPYAKNLMKEQRRKEVEELHPPEPQEMPKRVFRIGHEGAVAEEPFVASDFLSPNQTLEEPQPLVEPEGAFPF